MWWLDGWNLEGAQVTCVYDPCHGEEVAKEKGCQVEEVLEYFVARDDIDAVIVASPNYFHKEQIMAALRYKKHIFCEKPMAVTYQDRDETVESPKEVLVTFMTGPVICRTLASKINLFCY